MLEPMLNATSTPYAAGAPNIFDALEILSRKRSEHRLGNSPLRPRLSFQHVRRCDLDRRMQRAEQWALVCENPMNAFHSFARAFRRPKRKVDVNPSNHQHALISFNLASDGGREPALACVNFARLQRASEGAQHSAGRGGDKKIGRC